MDGKTVRAHRASWILHNGSIPPGLHVLHSCDNPPCVNPEHLFLGTDKDNAQDRENKKRSSGKGLEVATRRKRQAKYCKHGHHFTTENTYIHNDWRYCRACKARRERERKRKLAQRRLTQ